MTSLPTHLSENSAQGIVEGEPIAQFEIGDMRNFIYLLIDWKTRECAVVDPWKDLAPVLDAIAKYQLRPVLVLLTHTHHDHVGGLGELIEKFPGIPVALNELDVHRIKENIRKTAKLRYLKDGDALKVGSHKIEVLHTPGHSPGECSYYVPAATRDDRPYLFTGDTIFIRDCGRTDFAGGNVLDMFDSIQKVKTLPQRTVILCGHHYQPEVASTIANEMVDSAPFRCKNADELEALP